MRHFVTKILVFSAIVLSLIAAAEIYVRSLPNPARYKHQWMLAHSTEVETLILGSSHCFYGIDPAMLGPNAFNIAQPTQPYRYDWYQLTHYPLPNLKTIVLPFSYQSLFEDLEAEPRLHYWATRYRLYMDCDIHSPFSPYALECLHAASFKEKLTSLWRPAQLKWDSLGFGTSYGTTSLLLQGKDNGPQRADENTYHHRHSLALNTDMLDSIATWCDRRSVRLLLITTPTSPSFRQHCLASQIAVNDSTLPLLISRHPSISYHNYWDDSDFSPADFYDADHLNIKGAHKLTKKVIKDMRFQK
ncbi:MAG: hypothetical protein J6129_05350 [Bacteroidaceae bacterium]|nr:hypothetical protein [Bacteroidaceae bacterium]